MLDDDAPHSGVAGVGELRASLDSIPLPAAGYLAVAGAPIMPWCAAVLVAPDVVLTSAHCLQEVPRHDLGFAIGSTDAAESAVPIVEVLVHPEAGQAATDLAALRLETPIDDPVPAPLGLTTPDRCDLVSVSYLYVLEDTVGRRWTWRGCFDDTDGEATVAVTDGAPNCHGDTGAGIFSEAGALVGIVTGARYPDEETTCATVIAFAPVRDNAEFIEAALALSND